MNPGPIVVIFATVVGLVIGSFLNVVVWRVPRGESVASPPSHCPACGKPVRPRDNVPVLSWVLLHGRCRDCGSPISARYPLVEAGTAVAFGATAAVVGADWALPAFLYLAAIGVALALIDIDVRRLPNVIVLPSYVVVAALLLIPAVLDDRWDDYMRALLGAAALFAFYFLLAFVYPAGMGFGDVKLAGVLGMCLGWIGWGALIVGAFAGFLFGGVVGGALMAVGRAGRKTALPFGPFMIVGTAVGLSLGQSLTQAYLTTLVG